VVSDRTTAVYLGDHTALTRTVYGHKLYVDTRDVSLAPHLLLDGAWEMWITRLLEDLIEPGMTVVDAGANVGWYTLLAADRVGPSGRVVAFEANPETAALLRRTVEVNGFAGRTAVEAVALADRAGEVTLHALAEHRGTSSISAGWVEGQGFGAEATAVIVPATTLDAYAREHELRIDILKIDAEGAEPLIVAGAREVLEANPQIRVLLEYEPENRGALDILLELGFEASAIETDSTLRPLGAAELEGDASFAMLHLARPAPAAPGAGLTLLAFAEEILAEPAMLDDFALALGPDAGSTLVIYAPDQDPGELGERLGPLVEAAGGAGCRASFEALAVPSGPEAEQALVAGVDALFTGRPPAGAFTALPTVDRVHLRTLTS
jgi:FkbM family methyltransferase